MIHMYVYIIIYICMYVFIVFFMQLTAGLTSIEAALDEPTAS